MSSAIPKICSLLPSTTEILYQLGAGASVVGVSHECDFPQDALSKPRITRSRIPKTLTSAEIDKKVKELRQKGETLYEIDLDILKQIKPDIIVTQKLCEVCAVTYDNVARAAHMLNPVPELLSIEPNSLSGIYDSIETLGKAAGLESKAREIVTGLKKRENAVAEKVKNEPKPRVACLEWLNPPYAAGHWIPEMVSIAGAEDPLGNPGGKSKKIDWDTVRQADPEILILMACGWTIEKTRERLGDFNQFTGFNELKAVKSRRAYIVDGNCFTRPGPRLIDGIETLAKIFHPDLFPALTAEQAFRL